MKSWLIISAAVLMVAGAAPAETYTWIGNNQDWNTAAQWQDEGGSTGTVPGPSDIGVIDGARAKADTLLDSNITLQNGGSLLLGYLPNPRPVVTTPITVADSGGEIAGSDNRNLASPITLEGTLTLDWEGGSPRMLSVTGEISGTGDILVTATQVNSSAFNLGGKVDNTFLGTTRITTDAKLSMGWGSPQYYGFFGAAGNRVEIDSGGRLQGAALEGWTNDLYDLYGGNTSTPASLSPVKQNWNFTLSGRTMSPGAYDGSGTGVMIVERAVDFDNSIHGWSFANSAELLFHVGDGAADQFSLGVNWNIDLSDAVIQLEALEDWSDGTYTIVELTDAARTLAGQFTNTRDGANGLEVWGTTAAGGDWSADINYAGGDGNDVVLSNVFIQIISPCHPGDANGDGTVGIADLAALADYYGLSPATWSQGDFTGDRLVGIADLVVLADNYGWVGDPCTPTTVPEPATLLLMAVGAAVSIRRLRK